MDSEPASGRRISHGPEAGRSLVVSTEEPLRLATGKIN